MPLNGVTTFTDTITIVNNHFDNPMPVDIAADGTFDAYGMARPWWGGPLPHLIGKIDERGILHATSTSSSNKCEWERLLKKQ